MYLLVLVSCGRVKARDYGMRLELKPEIAPSAPDVVNSLDSYAWRACLACSRESDAFVTGDASAASITIEVVSPVPQSFGSGIVVPLGAIRTKLQNAPSAPCPLRARFSSAASVACGGDGGGGGGGVWCVWVVVIALVMRTITHEQKHPAGHSVRMRVGTEHSAMGEHNATGCKHTATVGISPLVPHRRRRPSPCL
jgi:hypothetical protein